MDNQMVTMEMFFLLALLALLAFPALFVCEQVMTFRIKAETSHKDSDSV